MAASPRFSLTSGRETIRTHGKVTLSVPLLEDQAHAQLQYSLPSSPLALQQEAIASIADFLKRIDTSRIQVNTSALGCGQRMPVQKSCLFRSLLRRLRNSAARSLASQHADASGGQAKLAFELDFATGALCDHLALSGVRCGGEAGEVTVHELLDLPQPRVGIFVIHGAPNPPVGAVLARVLSHAFWAPVHANKKMHALARLHVLLDERGLLKADFDLSTWFDRLGPAAALLGGTHICDYGHHLAPWRGHINQGNYMHKAWTMIRVAEMQGYDYILSTDDDVLLPARTIQAFVAAVTGTVAEGGAVPKPAASIYEANGCGVLLATTNSAVPTADLFAETYLPPAAQSRLSKCYSNSQLTKLRKRNFIVMDTKRLGAAVSPWNATEWYAAIKHNITGEGKYGAFKGVHPVRYNSTCTRLSLKLALESLSHWWAVPRSSRRRISVMPWDRYPYFTNTLWLASTEVYTAALSRRHLALDWYDEVPMNLYILGQLHRPICILPEPALHPAYNTAPDKSAQQHLALGAVKSLLGMERQDERKGRNEQPLLSVVTSESSGTAPLSGAFSSVEEDRMLAPTNTQELCRVSLTRQHSYRAECVHSVDGNANATFGCVGDLATATVWVARGCRGYFHCNGHVVKCGLAARGSDPEQRCECAARAKN